MPKRLIKKRSYTGIVYQGAWLERLNAFFLSFSSPRDVEKVCGLRLL